MRRIFYILAILLLPCITTAWANSTREITIKWELDSDPDNKKSLIREYTVTDTSGKCTTDNATYKIQNAKSERTFKCPDDITSIPLAFEFHTRNSPFKNFSETIQITDKKNYKIEKTLEYRGNDNILTGTILQLCKTEISSLLSEYCDDEGYTTGKNTISAPSYGGFMIGDDHRTITAGCYKFKKNNSTEKMRKKIAKKCNVPVSDVKIETFTRPTNDVKKNAEQTTTVPEKTKNTISGTLMLRNEKSGDYNTEPCKNCQILMNSRQIGTTNNDGKFNLEVSDQNAKITFKYNDDYETKTLTASEFSNSGNTKITLTPIPSASTQASPAQTDTTYTELKEAIFGYVKDLNNEPIIGAAVQILNSKNNNSQCGITTNIYGYWIISECQELPQNAQLQISSIGYKTKKISLASHKNRATITLEEENIPLDAVEVVACKTTNDKYPGGTEFKPADEQGLCGTDTDNPCDDGHKCIPTKCDETKYKLDYPNTLSAKCAEKECKPENAKSGKWTGTAGNWVCEVNECNDGFKKEDSNKKCIPMLKECTTEQLREHPNALETGIEPGTENCIALTCKCGYDLKDKMCEAWPATGKKCNSSTDPELQKNAKLAYMACKDNNKYCKIEECETNFKPNEDKTECISLKGECNPKPENAKKTHREFDDKTQTEICIIDECKKDFELSADKKSCVKIAKPKLSREDSQKKIDELQENADAMHDKEHSTANKLLGGAAIGATGIGAMQALSAYSEQQSDEDAEQAMKAYLATFHCNYGGGINVKGGEKDVQLPGGNELIGLYAEYVNLANNLKVRKAALDMRPGIESEAILDSATSGLYDDVSIGKTSGAFTSLARALQNPDGPDAQAWAAQKDDSAKKLKTGLTVAGIGAVGGAVGNLLINKDAPKENSKEILDKYKDGYLVSGDDLDLNNGETRSLAEAVQPDAAVLDVKQDKPKSQDSVGVVVNKDDWTVENRQYEDKYFYCESLFDSVYNYAETENNKELAAFEQGNMNNIKNISEKVYDMVLPCVAKYWDEAGAEKRCIQSVMGSLGVSVSEANVADCMDGNRLKTSWDSYYFESKNPVSGLYKSPDTLVKCSASNPEIKKCLYNWVHSYNSENPLETVRSILEDLNNVRGTKGMSQCSGTQLLASGGEFEQVLRKAANVCKRLACKYNGYGEDCTYTDYAFYINEQWRNDNAYVVLRPECVFALNDKDPGYDREHDAEEMLKEAGVAKDRYSVDRVSYDIEGGVKMIGIYLFPVIRGNQGTFLDSYLDCK